jgi:hypothetical protein
MSRINEFVIWPTKTTLIAKAQFVWYLCTHRFAHKTVLFYPELPKSYHVLYKIGHRSGWRITNNPHAHVDVAIHFEDTTKRMVPPELTALQKRTPILNLNCTDISKKKVDAVFKEVFGYQMTIDPRTHTGVCVRKSDINAVHDGTIVSCPTEPEDGYVYQHLIETDCGDGRVMDLRLPIFKDRIPFVLKRYKHTHDIFDITIDAEFAETDTVLSADEHAKVLAFCRLMGLDYGEIDALRSNGDGMLYIVDVNNTPAGPIGPLHACADKLARWFTTISEETDRAFFGELTTA